MAFLVVVLLLLGGLIYGMFTRVGDAIDHHPHDGSDGAPGAKDKNETWAGTRETAPPSTTMERDRRGMPDDDGAGILETALAPLLLP